VRRDDEYVDAYVNLGFIYLEKEEYEQALKCFMRVTELESDNPEAYNNLGYVYERWSAWAARSRCRACP
jgi:tetratricopeptide (TPR) repeat protein